MIRVVQYQRRPVQGAYSVERLFDDVRAHLPEDIQVELRVNRHPSRGFVGRLKDAFAARREAGAINHVLGDVHYLTWFLPRRNTILTVLDCVTLERLRGVRRWLFWFAWYWLPLRRVARVTVISQYTRRALLDWAKFPAELIDIIPPPLSPEFKPVPMRAVDSKLRLLQIGTKPNKNLPRVIEAVRDLPVILVVVGEIDDMQRELLSTFGIDYENVADLSRPEMLEQYARSDIVVFASTYEGFGLPIIEAQAVGRPVLTSNVCSMPEAAGGAACIVDPYDVADIRRGLVRLIEDAEYRAELIANGYENSSRYSVERVAEAYAYVYRALQSGGRQP